MELILLRLFLCQQLLLDLTKGGSSYISVDYRHKLWGSWVLLFGPPVKQRRIKSMFDQVTLNWRPQKILGLVVGDDTSSNPTHWERNKREGYLR